MPPSPRAPVIRSSQMRFRNLSILVAGGSAAGSFTVVPGAAQQRFTTADYARAEKMMGYNTTPLVYNSGVRPAWLADERFWYRITTANGNEFVLVDPARGTRQPAFDHTKLASAVNAAAG